MVLKIVVSSFNDGNDHDQCRCAYCLNVDVMTLVVNMTILNL